MRDIELYGTFSHFDRWPCGDQRGRNTGLQLGEKFQPRAVRHILVDEKAIDHVLARCIQEFLSRAERDHPEATGLQQEFEGLPHTCIVIDNTDDALPCPTHFVGIAYAHLCNVLRLITAWFGA